jgi:hypothetical protein
MAQNINEPTDTTTSKWLAIMTTILATNDGTKIINNLLLLIHITIQEKYSLVIFWFICFWSYRFIVPKKKHKEKEIPISFSKIAKKQRIIDIVSSLGLILIREFILDKLGVLYYESFARPKPWYEKSTWNAATPESIASHEKNIDWLDRIRFKNGIAKEYQYSRDHKTLTVKETEPNEIAFKDTIGDMQKEFLVLLFASNHFPFWYLIRKLKRIK